MHTERIESSSVLLRVLVVRTPPTDEILPVLAVSAVHNPEILMVLAVHIPRSTYSRNTTSVLSTRVVPSESNLLQLPLVGPSVRVLCQTMGL